MRGIDLERRWEASNFRLRCLSSKVEAEGLALVAGLSEQLLKVGVTGRLRGARG
jgi:hypothetical protein